MTTIQLSKNGLLFSRPIFSKCNNFVFAFIYQRRLRNSFYQLISYNINTNAIVILNDICTNNITKSKFNRPNSLELSKDGKTLYFSDEGNHNIQAICVSSGEMKTLVGSTHRIHRFNDNKFMNFYEPSQILLSPNGKLMYIIEHDCVIRVFDIENNQTSTLLFKTNGPNERYELRNMVLCPSGKGLFVYNYGSFKTILYICFETNKTKHYQIGEGLHSMIISPCNTMLFFSSRHGLMVIKIQKLSNYNVCSFYPLESTPNSYLTFSNNNKHLICTLFEPNNCIVQHNVVSDQRFYKSYIMFNIYKHSQISLDFIRNFNFT